jgi:hypothetical protein
MALNYTTEAVLHGQIAKLATEVLREIFNEVLHGSIKYLCRPEKPRSECNFLFCIYKHGLSRVLDLCRTTNIRGL